MTRFYSFAEDEFIDDGLYYCDHCGKAYKYSDCVEDFAGQNLCYKCMEMYKEFAYNHQEELLEIALNGNDVTAKDIEREWAYA